MVRICPACGKKESDVQFVGLFCIDCKLKRSKIEMPKVSIKVCKDCGKMRMHAWIEKDYNVVEKLVLGRIKGEFEGLEVLNRLSEENNFIEVKVIFQKMPEVSKVYRINVNFSKDLCVNCLKKRSHYYNVTIQTRGEHSEQIAHRIIGAINNEDPMQLSKTLEVKTGWDIFVKDRNVSQQIIKKMGYKPTVSFHLQSERDGKKLYRTVFCIRG